MNRLSIVGVDGILVAVLELGTGSWRFCSVLLPLGGIGGSDVTEF